MIDRIHIILFQLIFPNSIFKRLVSLYCSSLIFALLTWAAMWCMIWFLNLAGWIAILPFTFVVAILWLHTGYLAGCHWEAFRYAFALAALASALLIVWAIPAFVLYITLNAGMYKKGIQVSVFILSTGIGIGYYIANRQLFPTATDKVTYFTGVCLGPATAVSLIL